MGYRTSAVAVCSAGLLVHGMDSCAVSGNDNGKEPATENGQVQVFTPLVKKQHTWKNLQARVNKAKQKKVPCLRLYFCPVCGLDQFEKHHVYKHAKNVHKNTHPDFRLTEPIPLDDLEQYYYFIKKLTHPCVRAKHFIKIVEHPIEIVKKKEKLPTLVKKQQTWIDLQNAIDQGKEKPRSKQPHFCSLCGYDCSQKVHVFQHSKMIHKDARPTPTIEDGVLLDDVEKYYHFIKILKNPCPRAQHFIKTVENPVELLQKKRKLPSSVKKMKAWTDLQNKYVQGKGKKRCLRLHFCPICGFDARTKTCVFKHVKRVHHKKRTHLDFVLEDVRMVHKVKKYYHYISNLKKRHLHKKARHFRKAVKKEIRTNERKRKRTANNPVNTNQNKKSRTDKKKLKRNKRKRHHPRRTPVDIICATRFEKPEVRVPQGCENTSNVEIKIEPEEVYIKVEPCQ